jgi:type IV pilus assembly protein PilC
MTIQRFIKLAGIAVVAVLVAALVTATIVNRAMSLPLAIMLSLMILLAAIAWTSAVAAGKRRRALNVLGYVEQAVQLNLPLPRIFAALAENDFTASNRYGRQLIEARQALEAGAPLAIALSQFPQMPPRILDLIATAERIGRLPQVLSRVMHQRRTRLARISNVDPFYRTYACLVLAMLIAVTAMLMIFVVPKYEQIFQDFGLKLPWILQMSIELSRLFGPWSAVALIIALIAMIVSVVAAPARWTAFGLVERPAARVANRLPLIGRMRMHHALGEVLDFAADAIGAGQPIDTALLESSRITPNSRLRENVEQWVSAMRDGQSIADSARATGLPPLLHGMLATATDTDDLPEVFRFLARYYLSRFSRAAAIFEASFVPTVALLLGILVGWLALSTIVPLITLVNNLS